MVFPQKTDNLKLIHIKEMGRYGSKKEKTKTVYSKSENYICRCGYWHMLLTETKSVFETMELLNKP